MQCAPKRQLCRPSGTCSWTASHPGLTSWASICRPFRGWSGHSFHSTDSRRNPAGAFVKASDGPLKRDFVDLEVELAGGGSSDEENGGDVVPVGSVES